MFSADTGGQTYDKVQTVFDGPAVIVPAVTTLTGFSRERAPALLAANGVELDLLRTNYVDLFTHFLEGLTRIAGRLVYE